MAKFKDLTDEEVGNIIDWYDRGLYSQRELAEIFKCSRATIRRVVKVEKSPTEHISPVLGHYDEVGQPTERRVGQPETFPTWQAVLVAVAAVAWVGWVLSKAFK